MRSTSCARPAAPPRQAESVVIRHLDEHIVVVEKPSGLATTRHPTEREWSKTRKELTPTLEEIVPRLIQNMRQRPEKARLARLRVVQRLDKETSGLLVFARSVEAERVLGQQFRKHTVIRKYIAIVPGYLPQQTIQSRLVRDRGDGRRGSITLPNVGKAAVTHIDVVERLPAHTVLSCQPGNGPHASDPHPPCRDGPPGLRRQGLSPHQERRALAGHQRRAAPGPARRRAGLHASRQRRGAALGDAAA